LPDHLVHMAASDAQNNFQKTVSNFADFNQDKLNVHQELLVARRSLRNDWNDEQLGTKDRPSPTSQGGVSRSNSYRRRKVAYTIKTNQ
jgi:hypothetical protein